MIESPDREKISEILTDIDQADADGSAAALRSLWHEVGTACRL